MGYRHQAEGKEGATYEEDDGRYVYAREQRRTMESVGGGGRCTLCEEDDGCCVRRMMDAM